MKPWGMSVYMWTVYIISKSQNHYAATELYPQASPAFFSITLRHLLVLTQ